MKRSIMYAAAGAVLALVAARSAKADVLLFNFETGDTPDALDGFVGNSGTAAVSQVTTGATLGAHALQVSTVAGFASSYTQTIPAALSNPALTAISLTEGVPSTYTYGGTYALIGVRFFVYNGADPNNPINPGGPTNGQFQVDAANERAIPFSTPGTFPKVTIPLTAPDPDTGTDESFATLLSHGFTVTGFDFFFDKNSTITVDIDNVVGVGVGAVPEPASIGLLAAGGLALARRRRR